MKSNLIELAYWSYLIEDSKTLPNMTKEKMFEFGHSLTKDEFIEKIKHDVNFSYKFDLKIIEGFTLVSETHEMSDVTITRPVRKKKLTIIYKNQIEETDL